jgi:AraC family transcriptional regulator
MGETGAYGERMAGYLHLAEPPIHAALGFGRSALAVTRLHAPNGFSDPTSPIPLEKASQSICIFARAGAGGCGSPANWFPPGNDLREE